MDTNIVWSLIVIILFIVLIGLIIYCIIIRCEIDDGTAISIDNSTVNDILTRTETKRSVDEGSAEIIEI